MNFLNKTTARRLGNRVIQEYCIMGQGKVEAGRDGRESGVGSESTINK